MGSRLVFFLFLFLSPIALNAVANDKIEHVIVIMFENRSFDHIVGFMKQNDSRIDGCLPDMGKMCSNPMDPQDPSSEWYPVNNQAQMRQISDPDHSFVGTTDQVYGYGPDTQDPPPMSGFIKNYANKEIIMECFPPEEVPAMTTLASEFAIFQNWYSSVPGPTEVNRLYLYSATSDGSAANDDVRLAYGYPQRSIFENIDASKYNVTWGVYFEEAPTAFFIKYNRHDGNLHKFHGFQEFYNDVAAGTLPNFSFLEPRYFELPNIPANDQHPDHDVGLGDQLMKAVYEAVRASPKWNKTLLLITYDEHGGFFDHVPPPTDCPNPDGKNSHDTTPSFDFTRLGVRVPMLMISPWVKKGMVISEPMETHYEHSSLSATLLNLFMPDQQFLTKRDAWAQPFDWILDSVTEPRTDCPTTLPTAPTHRQYGILAPMDQLGNRPVTGLQKSLIKMASGLKTGKITETGEGMTEAEGAYYMRDKINEFLGREVVNFDRERLVSSFA